MIRAASIVLCLCAPVALFAEPSGKAVAAQQRLDHGLQLFDLQRYDEAIAEFKLGYEDDPRPDFLYAIAQAERAAGRCAPAIEAYKAYLRSNPAARQIKLAQFNIERCAEQLRKVAEQAPTLVLRVEEAAGRVVTLDGRDFDDEVLRAPIVSTPGRHEVVLRVPGHADQRSIVVLSAGEQRELSLNAGAALTAPVVTRSERRHLGPWLVFGAGLVVLAGGAITLGVAEARFGQLESACGTLCNRSQWTGWQRATYASYALLGIGAAVAVGGLTWRFAHSRHKRGTAVGMAPASLVVRFD
jgi:tetratricopeptide (TPR) repeat protein